MVLQTNNILKIDFRSLLLDMHDWKNRTYDLEYLNGLFSKAIINFGETEENINTAKSLEYGKIGENFGLKFKENSFFVYEIFQQLQNIPFPFFQQNLSSDFPGLEERDIYANLAFCEKVLRDLNTGGASLFWMNEAKLIGDLQRTEEKLLIGLNKRLKKIFSQDSIYFHYEGGRWGFVSENNYWAESLINSLEDVDFSRLDKNLSPPQISAGLRIMMLIFCIFESYRED
jgi:hypothetical protein